MSCQEEQLQEITINSEQQLNLETLPKHVREKAQQSQSYFLKVGKTNTSSKYNGASFGPIDPSAATHTIDRQDNDSYALALERGSDPRAIDNMVIVDNGNGETKSYVIRHLPTDDWFYENPNSKDFGLEFSGTIQIFDEENGLIASSELKDGDLISSSRKNDFTTKGSWSCSIASVQNAGLVQNGIFYITETLITFKCTFEGGGGGGFDNPFGDPTYGDDPNDNSSGGSGNGQNPVLDYDPLMPECPVGYINAPIENGCVPANYQKFLEFEQDYRSRMSDQEKQLFDTLSTKQKTDYLLSAFEAEQEASNIFPTSCERLNGKGDAYRHALWNALSAKRIGSFLTKQLTTAHEEKPHTYAFQGKGNGFI
ncbi:hypothetical protein [uncultured Croceitalea sp.]|uniref:DUF6973 domain-containing protein n=1 Tax=uncultured Croceitalea sp. TaxID=1798908 RepID=UPI00330567A3